MFPNIGVAHLSAHTRLVDTLLCREVERLWTCLKFIHVFYTGHGWLLVYIVIWDVLCLSHPLGFTCGVVLSCYWYVIHGFEKLYGLFSLVFGPSLVNETGFPVGWFMVSDPGHPVGIYMVFYKLPVSKVIYTYFVGSPLHSTHAVPPAGYGENFAPPTSVPFPTLPQQQ